MWRAALGVLLLVTACASSAQGISRNTIVELAGQGRYDELADRLAADTPRLSPGQLHALCHAYAQTKRYRPLLACLDRLEGTLRGRDRASILFGLDDATATVPLMRAAALLDLGDAPAAAEQATRALAWFDREGSAGERDLQVEALTLLALAAARQQEPAKAQDILRRITAIQPGLGAAPNLANVRTLGLARGHLALGQYDQACAALDSDRSFDFRRSVDALLNGNPPNWVWQQLPRLFMLARCRQGQGRVTEAKAAYDELLALPVLRQNRGIAWLVLHGRARIAEDEGEREGAVRLLREALEIIEQLRSSIDTEAAKIGFVGDKQAVYGALIALLMAQGKPAEALEVVERAKARALVDLLADRYGAAAAEQVLPRGDARLASLLLRHREAEETLQAQNPARGEAAWVQQRNSVLQATQQLRQAAPELASLMSASAATAAELVQLLDKDEVGLQYYVQGDRLYAVVFGPHLGSTGSRAYTLDGVGLLNDVRDFRAAITRRTPQALVLAQKLHGRLIAPLQEALGRQAVLLVPHGVLHYLPFAALHDGQRFLLDRHPLRLSTSASALKFLRQTPAVAGAPVLILGNPTGDLPSAEQEARRLKRLLPGSTLLLGPAATRAALFAQAPPARTVHIASHALFDARQPLDSRLILAPVGALDTGELRVSDIYGLQLTADLVTLSACETGLGRITDGGEVIGMTRGFLYAGASSVVASLWQVPDDATATLMEGFYAKLPRQNKRDALRAAQLDLMRRGEPPYAWASFYLSGSTR
jgi:CHAT domain-containing protein